MSVDLLTLNSLGRQELMSQLERCCGSRRWCMEMATRRPFADRQALMEAADEIWHSLSPEDWLEAFAHHPRIGDLESLRTKFGSTRQWAGGEQAGIKGADEEVLSALAEGNKSYEDRFGYIFIVCATGKSAQEMLAMLKSRLANNPDEELRIAMAEQARITRIRLEKLLT